MGRGARLAAVLAILLGSAAALASCASLSQAECVSGDWRVIGFNDGASGQPAGRVGDHGEACARYGVAPDLELWRLGYDEGLIAYCTRPNGFRAGVQGATYHGVCAGPAADEFIVAYQDGRHVYDARQALNLAQNDLSEVENELDDVRQDRDEARADADAEGVSPESRRAYLDEAERLSERLGELRRRRDELDQVTRNIAEDVRRIEADMRSYYPEWSGY
jgi:hypothetical protein